jgi:hypothetical protein
LRLQWTFHELRNVLARLVVQDSGAIVFGSSHDVMSTFCFSLICKTFIFCDNGHDICISGLVVEYIVAIDVTRVRFPADAFDKLFFWQFQHTGV